jgi:hypothetical protein
MLGETRTRGYCLPQANELIRQLSENTGHCAPLDHIEWMLTSHVAAHIGAIAPSAPRGKFSKALSTGPPPANAFNGNRAA